MIYIELFLTFFKIGAFTFGGGYAMLPLICEEALSRGWMTGEALVDFMAVSESTPGPFAVNMATYTGYETAGFLGATAATVGVVLPSFAVILLIALIYDRFRKSFGVKACMRGIKPCVVGLIGAAVLSVGRTVFFPEGISLSAFTQREFIFKALIFVLAATALSFKKLKLHPVLVICLCAFLGIAAGYGLDLQV
ncbi:MAG: chromate transporter [Ruminococcaceae bacterium]|nr:chromate transporter [Oscillospiraceae bacterium]